jgi:hypothetical protein
MVTTDASAHHSRARPEIADISPCQPNDTASDAHTGVCHARIKRTIGELDWSINGSGGGNLALGVTGSCQPRALAGVTQSHPQAHSQSWNQGQGSVGYGSPQKRS